MLHTELIPADQTGSQRLIVVLHGLGDSMDGYRWFPAALRLPWLNYLLVDAPDSYYGGYSWYDFAGDPAPGIGRSRALLGELLDGMRERFPTEQTLMFGFSQGCLMTYEIGLRYPHRFAGLIGVSGHVHDPETLLLELSPVARQQRFLITHGREDTLIPIEPVKKQVELLQRAGLRIVWQEFRKAHTIAGGEEIGMIRDFIENCLAR